MSKLSKKRQILTATLAVAMASALLVNWYYNRDTVKGNNEESTKPKTENLGDSIYVNGTTASSEEAQEDEEVRDVAKIQEYFAEAQLKRTQAHDEALDKIEQLLDNGKDDTQVEKLLEEYSNSIKLEADIENLITAKIGCECLVILNSENAQIVVDSQGIDELYLLQITEIVSTQANIPAEKIAIIEAK